MKKNSNDTRDNYTLLQDIIDTYRYPDGTLNKIAIFISTLALVLLITLGHFMILGIKNLRSMKTVSASELTVDEIQEYITNSYLDAIDDYTDGDLNQEAAKRKILKFLAEYIESSNGFTTEQNQALEEIINQYLTENDIYSDIQSNKDAIDDLTSIIENKYEENKTYVDQLIQLLQGELDENKTTDEKDRKELISEIEKLKAYTDGQLNEQSENLTSMIDGLRRTYQNSLGAADYAPGSTYNKGAYVIYNEHLYVSLKDNNTASPSDSSAWELTDLEKIINNLEKSIHEEMESMHDELKLSQEEGDAMLQENMDTKDNDLQEQIDRINDRISDNETYFEFGYDPVTNSHGYYVGNEFKPF